MGGDIQHTKRKLLLLTDLTRGLEFVAAHGSSLILQFTKTITTTTTPNEALRLSRARCRRNQYHLWTNTRGSSKRSLGGLACGFGNPTCVSGSPNFASNFRHTIVSM